MTASTPCRHLGPGVRVPGSSRDWQRCLGGYGSTAGGDRDPRRGLVVVCPTPQPGVWRVGHECGPGCPAYAPAGMMDGRANRPA